MSMKRTVKRIPKNHDHNQDAQLISALLPVVEKPKPIKLPKRMATLDQSAFMWCKPRLTRSERLAAAKKRRRSHRKTRHVSA